MVEEKEDMIMRNRLLALSVVILLGVAPAAAQKVHVDYDRSVDFGTYKTFAWGRTPDTSLEAESPLMHSRLKNAIEYRLTEGGMTEDTENPDVYVTYHTSSKEEIQLHTTGMGYGYGGGWGYDPYWGGIFTRRFT